MVHELKFVGSKSRVSKQIAPILQTLIDNNNVSLYYEPFCGGLNMMDKIECSIKVGNDSHKELIALWKKLQDGWNPPETITEEEYNSVRENPSAYPDYYVGLVGFAATFGSKWFGGYARGFKDDKVTPRDIPNEAIRNIMKPVPLIKNVRLTCKNYLDVDMEKLSNTLIYCDPPYKNTTKYATDNFDYNRFYNWCREVSKTNILCVSEYQMPPDFVCIWQKDVTTSLKVHKHEPRTERLFMLNPEKYGLHQYTA